jgi:predicted nucleic acid-binding protein
VVIVDTSAWIEFFRDGEPSVVRKVDRCLERNIVGVGDLIYCEIMQGIKAPAERKTVSTLLLSLPRYDMVGFTIAEKGAENYRLLRTKGITIRKTIDVIIATFCVESGFQLVHYDRDFSHMVPVFGLEIF